MRATIMALAALPLVACGGSGGGGVASIGSSAGATGGTATPTPAATPTPTATPKPTAPAATQANLFDVKTATTFDAVGAMHAMTVDKDGREMYTGNASTVAAPSGTISYDPRDGVFVLSLGDAKSGVARDVTFQDPRHRTTSDPQDVERQVPLLAGFNYLLVLDGEVPLTFFYQRPNSSGAFVSLAGFERNEKTDDGTTISEQGVFVFGSRSTALQTPTKGSARFDGQFLATMVVQQGGSPSVQQWLNGTSAVDVDFGKRSLTLALSGTVGPGFFKDAPIADAALTIPSGATFAATGSAGWTAASTAFAGTFASAGFTSGGIAVPIDFTAVSAGTSSAGASSIDGTFYGPDAKNIGGNFRIVGGIPNQRVDIMGGFVGGKK